MAENDESSNEIRKRIQKKAALGNKMPSILRNKRIAKKQIAPAYIYGES
jgi:hypothetical protein